MLRCGERSGWWVYCFGIWIWDLDLGFVDTGYLLAYLSTSLAVYVCA